MKKLIIVILTGLTLSCSKSNSNNNNYYYKFKIDNVEYSATEFAASNSNNILTITAVGPNFYSGISSPGLTSGNYGGIGNYLLGINQYQLTVNLDGINLYQVKNGQLNITKSGSGVIEGNFSGTLQYLSDTTISKQLTSGEFLLPLVQ